MGQNDIDESEQLSDRRYVQRKVVYTNGNGTNKIVWAAAAFFFAVAITINGYMWKAQIDFTRDVVQRLATLEAQMTILLSRQQ